MQEEGEFDIIGSLDRKAFYMIEAKSPEVDNYEIMPKRLKNVQEFLNTPYFDKVIGSHREWLKSFGENYLEDWDDLFLYNNTEAAACEAFTREVLEELDIDVEPVDKRVNRKNPDFKCSRGEEVFYVEVTCITKDAATKHSALEDYPTDNKVTHFAMLTKSIFQETVNKTPQCSNLNSPCVLAIGT